MPGWSKKDTTKAAPSKIGYEGRDYLPKPKKGIEFDHNIYDLVGSNLLRAFKEGDLTKKQLDNMLNQLSLEAQVDLGKGYEVNLGYNVPSRDIGQQHRIKFTKKF